MFEWILSLALKESEKIMIIEKEKSFHFFCLLWEDVHRSETSMMNENENALLFTCTERAGQF